MNRMRITIALTFPVGVDFQFPFGQRTLFPNIKNGRIAIGFPFGRRTLFPPEREYEVTNGK